MASLLSVWRERKLSRIALNHFNHSFESHFGWLGFELLLRVSISFPRSSLVLNLWRPSRSLILSRACVCLCERENDQWIVCASGGNFRLVDKFLWRSCSCYMTRCDLGFWYLSGAVSIPCCNDSVHRKRSRQKLVRRDMSWVMPLHHYFCPVHRCNRSLDYSFLQGCWSKWYWILLSYLRGVEGDEEELSPQSYANTC